MKGKLSNGTLVAVLVIAFSLFVAGLANSNDGPRAIQAGATPTPTRTPTPVNIGNFVWRDLDSDGIQDVGEPGIPNVTMQVWNDAKSVLIDDAISNASGSYTVTTPTPGTFQLRVVVPAGAFVSPANQGVDDLKDSDFSVTTGFVQVVIASNVISTTMWDVGLILPTYLPVTPARLLDTRPAGVTVDGQFQAGGKLTAGQTIELDVVGRGGVPEIAYTVTLNLTAIQPAATGFLTVYPCDVARPVASSLNYAGGGAPIANEIIAEPGDGGLVCIYTSQAVHLAVDATGAQIS